MENVASRRRLKQIQETQTSNKKAFEVLIKLGNIRRFCWDHLKRNENNRQHVSNPKWALSWLGYRGLYYLVTL